MTVIQQSPELPICEKDVVDIAARMLNAKTFDQQWAEINGILAQFGATAVNAAAIERRVAEARWFRSTLSTAIVQEYGCAGHWRHDCIVAGAAALPQRYVWRTADAPPNVAHSSFTGFVRDTGTSAIVAFSSALDRRHVRCLAFCSSLPAKEVIDDRNLARIETASRLLLPWIGWPDDLSATGFVPLRKVALAKREREALALLAGGLLNARIAEAMGVSEATISKHLLSARAKLGARTREQAVAIAASEGLIDL